MRGCICVRKRHSEERRERDLSLLYFPLKEMKKQIKWFRWEAKKKKSQGAYKNICLDKKHSGRKEEKKTTPTETRQHKL